MKLSGTRAKHWLGNFIIVWLGLLSINSVNAQVPQLINYQGRVVVGSTNFNGSGQFAFALVNTNGSATYWSNDGTSTAGSQPTSSVTLTVTNGLYSVVLGDTAVTNMTAVPASVFNNPDVRLRVWFNDGTHGFQLLTPDQRIAAVGYAMVANTAQNVAAGAVNSAAIAPGSVGSSQLASSINLSGTVTAGTFSGSGSGLTNVNAATLGGLGSSSFAPFSGSLSYIQNTASSAQSASFDITGSGQVGGNLTVNGNLSGGGITIANGIISPQIIPAGSIMAYMGTTAPSGWLFCDGSSQSRTQYAALFAAIGTASGAGDGSTTFDLPDMRGYFLRGVDGGAGRDLLTTSRTAESAGGNTGDAVGSVQVPYNSILPPHNHGISDPGITGVSGTGSTSGVLVGTGTFTRTIFTGISVNSNGGGPTGGETHPLNIYVNYIIKY